MLHVIKIDAFLRFFELSIECQIIQRQCGEGFENSVGQRQIRKQHFLGIGAADKIFRQSIELFAQVVEFQRVLQRADFRLDRAEKRAAVFTVIRVFCRLNRRC